VQVFTGVAWFEAQSNHLHVCADIIRSDVHPACTRLRRPPELAMYAALLLLSLVLPVQFPQIPHYHLVEATEAAKKVMGPYYR